MGQKLGAEFLGTFWLFWVAPIAGAALAGFAYRWLGKNEA